MIEDNYNIKYQISRQHPPCLQSRSGHHKPLICNCYTWAIPKVLPITNLLTFETFYPSINFHQHGACLCWCASIVFHHIYNGVFKPPKHHAKCLKKIHQDLAVHSEVPRLLKWEVVENPGNFCGATILTLLCRKK